MMNIPRLNFSKLKGHSKTVASRNGECDATGAPSANGNIHIDENNETTCSVGKGELEHAPSSRLPLSQSHSLMYVKAEESNNNCIIDNQISVTPRCKVNVGSQLSKTINELPFSENATYNTHVPNSLSSRTIDHSTTATSGRTMNSADNEVGVKETLTERSRALMNVIGFDISRCDNVFVLQSKLIESCEKFIQLESYYEHELNERMNYFVHRLRTLTEHQLRKNLLPTSATVLSSREKQNMLGNESRVRSSITPRSDSVQGSVTFSRAQDNRQRSKTANVPIISISKMINSPYDVARKIEDAINNASRKNVNHMYRSFNNSYNSSRSHYKNYSNDISSAENFNTFRHTNKNRLFNRNNNYVHNNKSSLSTPFLTPASHLRSVHPFNVEHEYTSLESKRENTNCQMPIVYQKECEQYEKHSRQPSPRQENNVALQNNCIEQNQYEHNRPTPMHKDYKQGNGTRNNQAQKLRINQITTFPRSISGVNSTNTFALSSSNTTTTLRSTPSTLHDKVSLHTPRPRRASSVEITLYNSHQNAQLTDPSNRRQLQRSEAQSRVSHFKSNSAAEQRHIMNNNATWCEVDDTNYCKQKKEEEEEEFLKKGKKEEQLEEECMREEQYIRQEHQEVYREMNKDKEVYSSKQETREENKIVNSDDSNVDLLLNEMSDRNNTKQFVVRMLETKSEQEDLVSNTSEPFKNAKTENIVHTNNAASVKRHDNKLTLMNRGIKSKNKSKENADFESKTANGFERTFELNVQEVKIDNISNPSELNLLNTVNGSMSTVVENVEPSL